MASNVWSTLVGVILGVLLGVSLKTFTEDALPREVRRLTAIQTLVTGESGPPPVFWNNSVLPQNIVNQAFAVAKNPNYGYHVFALGANGSLFHRFQTAPESSGNVPMSTWHVLTKNASLIWANDPAVAANADGRLELFVAYKADSLDLWQMYQTDAKDPLAWSKPRAPSCLCGCPDPDPSKCSWCNDCDSRPECSKHYWSTGCPFTTSDMTLFLDPADQKLKLHYRSFAGHMFRMDQAAPSNSDQWPIVGVDLGFSE